MPEPTNYTDDELFKLLKANKEEAIDHLFRRYYTFVCQIAFRIIRDANISEDLAQEVFYNLWNKRDRLMITTSVKAYLSRSVKNRTLNYIRDQKMKFEDEENLPDTPSYFSGAHQELEKEELQQVITVAVNQLPEKCRIVFSLSRYENMSYKEIAEELGISIKTVENQISKALKHLRKAVEKYE